MGVDHPTRTKLILPEGKPLLEVKGLEVSYGGIRALKGIDLHVMPKEIVAMIGSNGAGKTTTLKSIARLLPIGSGEILFAGQPINGVATEALVSMGVSLSFPKAARFFPTSPFAKTSSSVPTPIATPKRCAKRSKTWSNSSHAWANA